jgi:hypothetical protein
MRGPSRRCSGRQRGHCSAQRIRRTRHLGRDWPGLVSRRDDQVGPTAQRGNQLCRDIAGPGTVGQGKTPSPGLRGRGPLSPSTVGRRETQGGEQFGPYLVPTLGTIALPARVEGEPLGVTGQAGVATETSLEELLPAASPQDGLNMVLEDRNCSARFCACSACALRARHRLPMSIVFQPSATWQTTKAGIRRPRHWPIAACRPMFVHDRPGHWLFWNAACCLFPRLPTV